MTVPTPQPIGRPGTFPTPTPVGVVLRTDDALGVDVGGADVTVQGGRPTGAGAPGRIIFETASGGGAAGDTLQAVATRLEIDGATVSISGSRSLTADTVVLASTPINDLATIPDDVTVVRLDNTSGGAVDLGGIVAPTTGRMLVFVNISANDINFLDQSGSASAAANQFAFPDGSDVTIGQNASLTLWYDLVTQRWRPIAQVL